MPSKYKVLEGRKATSSPQSEKGSGAFPASGYARVAAALPEVLRAMDCLWGALDCAHDILSQTVDSQDGRLIRMQDALCKAQEHLMPFFENGKVILPP